MTEEEYKKKKKGRDVKLPKSIEFYEGDDVLKPPAELTAGTVK